ncbi:MAG: hypothetical protein CL878_03730 [Dehalococcoidia bacterium]|nr:hypothetical protein [Dehalococcoidia bacterium]
MLRYEVKQQVVTVDVTKQHLSDHPPSARRSAGWLAAVFVAFLLVCLNASVAAAQFRDEPLEDYRVVNGHYFTQAGGDPDGDEGFRISDENGVNFASEFERLGGVEVLGYPISRRFSWDGFAVQATQKAVLQWHPQANRAALVNLLDAFSDAGLDSWLEQHARIPRRQVLHDETGLTFEEVVAARLSYLDGFPALRSAYLSTPDALERYGLPAAPIANFGSVRVLRTQRAAFQESRVWTSSTRPGQVTVLDVGTLAIEADLIPTAAIEAIAASETLATLPGSPILRVEDALLAELRSVAERAGRAVVKLTDGRTGAGSGVLYDPEGLIYTNYHVVWPLDRRQLRAELPDGRTFPARVLAGDNWADVAVLKIEGDDLPAIPIGDSQSVQPGDWILGIGHAPLLPGTPSAKVGRVSSTEGRIQAEDDFPHTGLIQTNLFLSPGDSGGPLINRRGELVGLNTAIRVARRGRSLTGFSIPLARVQQIAARLLSPEGIPRPQFGFAPVNMNRGLALQTGHRLNYGVYVRDVLPNSGAKAAGLQAGSVIISMDGRSVEDIGALRRLMIRHEVGDEVEVVVVTPSGERRSLTVRLGMAAALT